MKRTLFLLTALGMFAGQAWAQNANCGNSFEYNVLCFGADPTGKLDSSSAIQQAIDKAAGAPVDIPGGKYLLKSPIVIQAGNNSPGPRLQGAGQDVTALEPCFVGNHPMPAPGAAIVVDGTRKAGIPYPYRFAIGGYLRGLTIDGAMARATHPGLNCPESQAAGLDGVEISAWWSAEIEDMHITGMGGDAISVPWRQDMITLSGCPSPDCFASVEVEFKHMRLIGNFGWGVDAGAANAFSADGITESIIEHNAAGGVYLFGWQNWIVNNTIAANGCWITDAPSTGTCIRTQPGGTLSPQPGGGIMLARFNPDPTHPEVFFSMLGIRIERNELDSNYGYAIWVQAGDNAQIIQNRVLGHPIMWRTGPGGNYPHCQVVLGFPEPTARAVVRNTYLRNNLTRTEPNTHSAADFETQMYCVDPSTVAYTSEELDTTFGTNTSNFSVLGAGGGAAAVCGQSGGKVTACQVQVGGWYPAKNPPQVSIAGPGCSGQSARVKMDVPPGGNWGWVSSIQIENPGNGCTDAVWVVFSSVPYPASNQMQNLFRGYNPRTNQHPNADYEILTAPRNQ